MPIIDVHTHAFPEKIARSAVASLEAAGGLRAFYDGSIPDLLAEMDRTGVDVSLVHPVATKPEQVASINDWIVSLSDLRIVPFGAMHPEFADPAPEVARLAAAGVRGFKLHPEHQAFEPHDPKLAPVYEAAIEHGMIVFFHAGADEIHTTCRGTPESFAAVLDTWPEVTLVLAHLGGYRRWKGVAEILEGRRVWLDTAYTLGHLPDDEFVRLVRSHGVERVLFGSDGPWTDPAAEIAHLARLDFTEDELDAILGRNAAELLGL